MPVRSRRRRGRARREGGVAGQRRAGRDGHDAHPRARASRCTGRDLQGAPAAVPGGQLLRRRRRRAPRARPRCDDGDTVSRHADVRRRCRSASSSRSFRATPARTCGRPCRSSARGSGGRRRPWLQPVDPASGARVQVLGDRQRRDAGRAAGTTCRATSSPAGAVARALDRDPAALRSLIDDLATTFGAFASEQAQPDRGGRRAAADARQRPPRAAIAQRGVPAAAALRARLPARRSAPPGPPLDAQLPLVRELRGLVARAELRGLVADLRTTVPRLVELNRGGVALQEQGRLPGQLPDSRSSCPGSSTASPTRSSRRPAT